jgi:hypothetical protein
MNDHTKTGLPMIAYIIAIAFLLVMVTFCVAAIGLNYVRHEERNPARDALKVREGSATPVLRRENLSLQRHAVN